MATALCVANAVCEARLRARAHLMALGIDAKRITDWENPSPDSAICGLNVDGKSACVIGSSWGNELLIAIEGAVSIYVNWSSDAYRANVLT